jgi:hypothetical protein
MNKGMNAAPKQANFTALRFARTFGLSTWKPMISSTKMPRSNRQNTARHASKPNCKEE